MPKTYRSLYPTLCSFQNLYSAYEKARRRKTKRDYVLRFDYNPEERLMQLCEELAQKRYRHAPLHAFHVFRPKRRLIKAATFRDRIVHHALCNVIEPIFERRFIYDSYANRIGKGVHRAVDRFTQFARQNRYVLKCDIHKYFYSIDYDILLGILARRIRDEDVLWLVQEILRGGQRLTPDSEREEARPPDYFPGDDLFAILRPRGLPLGNLTSQFFGNVYLNELDYFVKHELRHPYYIRYVDDFVAFANEKRELHELRAAIEDFLATLRLRIHPRKCLVAPVATGIDFLGYQLFPTHRRLRRSTGVAFERRLRRLAEDYADGLVSLRQVRASIAGWLGHAKHADTYGLRRSIFRKVRFARRQSS